MRNLLPQKEASTVYVYFVCYVYVFVVGEFVDFFVQLKAQCNPIHAYLGVRDQSLMGPMLAFHRHYWSNCCKMCHKAFFHQKYNFGRAQWQELQVVIWSCHLTHTQTRICTNKGIHAHARTHTCSLCFSLSQKYHKVQPCWRFLSEKKIRVFLL